MKYKKTFYFENNSAFEIKCESDLTLSELKEKYVDIYKRGGIDVEISGNEINIFDLKKVQLINIKEVKDE